MDSSSSLIKEGSYGCAFTPPLPCRKSKAAPGKRQVGKVIKKKNAEIELSISELVRGIDGAEDYFLVQEEDNCDTRNFLKLRRMYGEDCKTLEKSPAYSLTQLLAPYGGMTLEKMAIGSSFKFIKFLKHVLKGVSLLTAQGICHFDLHYGNLTIDYKEVPRIIDFGSAYQGDYVDESIVYRHTYEFSPEYPPQPPELSVQNGLVQKLGLAYSVQGTVTTKKIFRDLQTFCGVPVEESRKELVDFWQHEKYYTGGSWVPFFHTYWRTWDAWAVGVLGMYVLKKCFLNPSFVNGEWATHGTVIKEVLRGLLRASPLHRLRAEEALRLVRG